MLGYCASSISGSWAPPPCGVLWGWIVLTAKSPQACAAWLRPSAHFWVSWPSTTGPVAVYFGYDVGIPFESSTEFVAAPLPVAGSKARSGLVSSGERAAISHWWLRKDPPK